MNAPAIDPVLIALGPIEIRWYGLMYVIGYIIAGQLIKKLAKEGFFKPGAEKADSLIMYMLIGMFIGARIFYVFIYNWDYYSNNLMDLFAVWKGGLSFHGAITGMFVAAVLFAKKNQIPFLQVCDTAVITGSQGVFFGRMGNFINGELYGRVTNSPLGMIFPGGGPYPRHPSQVYEAVSEGIILFSILWLTRKKMSHYGTSTAIFFGFYATARFFIEFFREPDAQLGYYFGGTITMGQILCFLQLLVAVGVYFYARSKRDSLSITWASQPVSSEN